MTTLNDLTTNYYDDTHSLVEPVVLNAHYHKLGCLDADSELGHREAHVVVLDQMLHIHYEDCPTFQAVASAFDQPPLGVQLNLF